MKLKVMKMYEDVKLPEYATDGSACFDIYAYGLVKEYAETVPTKTFSTGLKFEIPSGFVMLVFSRSGHGFNFNTRLANCVGVIDSDYRGELAVKLINDEKVPLSVYAGDRIAQAMLIPVAQVEFQEVEKLSETFRGSNGFGSTG